MAKPKSDMSEKEFIDSIDGSLAFRSEVEWRSAIEAAGAISDNALLMVVYELATGTTRDEERIRFLLEMQRKSYRTLVQSGIEIACSVIKGMPSDRSRLLDLIAHARSSRGSYNALALAELADPSLSRECDSIRKSWST